VKNTTTAIFSCTTYRNLKYNQLKVKNTKMLRKVIVYVPKTTKATFQDGEHCKVTCNWRAMNRTAGFLQHLLDALNVFIFYLCWPLKWWGLRLGFGWETVRDLSETLQRCLGCVHQVTVMLKGEPSPQSKVECTLKQVFFCFFLMTSLYLAAFFIHSIVTSFPWAEMSPHPP